MENHFYTRGQVSHSGIPMPKNAGTAPGFGARLAQLRKAAGYTQTELAAALGTTQRVIAYYEGETDHPPTTLLPQMAEALGVTADELLGLKAPRKSKAPDTRMQRRLQQIERMPARERRQILQVLDAFIERAQLKADA